MAALPRRRQQRERLSTVPENARVEARLLFSLIGPGAWQLAEALSRKATETFPSVASRSWFAFKQKLPARQSRKVRSASSESRSADNAPFGCKVLLSEEEDVAASQPIRPREGRRNSELLRAGSTSSALGKPREGRRNSELLRAGSTSSALGKPREGRRNSELLRAGSTSTSLGQRRRGRRTSKTSRTSRISWASAKSEQVQRRMAAISYFPVEHFHDEVPIKQAADRWRHSCLVFLLDHRQMSVLPELQRRQQEIMMWMRLHSPLARKSHHDGAVHDGVVPSPSAPPPSPSPSSLSKRGGERKIYAFVLCHRPPQAWISTDPAESIGGSEGADQSAVKTSSSVSTEERYREFAQTIKDMASLPDGAVLWHECDFDDAEEVLRCHVKIAQSIVDAPVKEAQMPEISDSSTTLATELNLGDLVEEGQGRACCAVM